MEKYTTDIDGLKGTLEKYGVAIIPSVLNDEECASMVSGLWDFFECITSSWPVPISRTNEKSWLGFYDLSPARCMLLHHFGAGHAQACWDLRQNPKIVEIFARFWGCDPEDLLVSFDGFGFHMPQEVTKRKIIRKPWYHTDQSYKHAGFDCIQSWVTGLDVRRGDATLSVMEGSHIYHDEFISEFGSNKKPGNLSAPEEQFFRDRGCQYVDIQCPKGSLVLWDARTIHCGLQPSTDRAESNLRAVVYLCYVPRRRCTNAQLKKKQRVFDAQRTTYHWPDRIKMFPLKPHTYSYDKPQVEITPIPRAELTRLGKKLAGF